MRLSKTARSIQNFKNYVPLLKELVSRDLKVKYRRSALGYVWSMLNPLLMMTIQAIVFSFVFRSDIENFPLYLICGNTLFTFFNESTTMALGSILGNASLIKKVYIPKYIFPVSRVMSSLVTTLFSMGAILIVMIFTRAAVHPSILLVWYPLGCMFLFNCGISLILSSMTVYFRDLWHLYGVITMGLTYLTPIFYPINILPDAFRNIVASLPLYHYITFFRSIVLSGKVPEASLWGSCALWSIAALILGTITFKRLQKNFILYI